VAGERWGTCTVCAVHVKWIVFGCAVSKKGLSPTYWPSLSARWIAELQSDEMSDFWSGLLLGFFFGVVGNVLVTHYGEIVARSRAHAAAKRLVGTWEAYNIHGRIVDSTPMPGAGFTEISTRSRRWSADSHVLQVSGVDVSDGRHHSGTLVIDPVCPRLATRILIYDDPECEVMEQRIVISQDFKTLFVFIVIATLGLPAYRPAHALRKIEAATGPVS
jgi:hypothetical protein